MSQHTNHFLGGFALGALISAGVLGLLLALAINTVQANWRSECIKRGVAEYNSTTGAWQWKESEAVK